MFENVINFFKKIGKKEEKPISSNSKDAAKERLHLVLMQDRANVSADFLELMKQEIIEVIKKYIEVDESAIDVRLTNKENDDGTNGAPALYANIPIINIKNDARKVGPQEIEEKNEKENQKEKEQTNSKKEEEKIESPEKPKNAKVSSENKAKKDEENSKKDSKDETIQKNNKQEKRKEEGKNAKQETIAKEEIKQEIKQEKKSEKEKEEPNEKQETKIETKEEVKSKK